MREAAALPLVTITAWEGLVDRARVHAGQTVLIHAGAGGVGHIAVQLARAYGAKVFATVSPDKKKIVEDFGATPIDYRSAFSGSLCGGEALHGHVLSSLAWGSHSLAPLSFRGATYSGVFTLLPLLIGENRAHDGKILAQVAALADAGKLGKNILASPITQA